MTNQTHQEHMTSTTLEDLSSHITIKEIDTLMLSKFFQQFGFSEQQSDAVSEALKQTKNISETVIDEKITAYKKEKAAEISDLATKNDLLVTKRELELQIEKVRAELCIQIETIKSDLIKWVAGLMIANTGLLFTLIKFFN